MPVAKPGVVAPPPDVLNRRVPTAMMSSGEQDVEVPTATPVNPASPSIWKREKKRKEWYPENFQPGWNTLEVDDQLDHFAHARTLLSQIYYRQNMYMHSAQYCESKDVSFYLAPIMVMGGLASFCGFAATSPLVSEEPDIRNSVSLFGGLLGVLVTIFTSLRSQNKFDVKAEMFRGAANQYSMLATTVEARMRAHRNLIDSKLWEGNEVLQKQENDDFRSFFASTYRRIMTSQAEMSYFPPQSLVAEIREQKALVPDEIDQPDIDKRDVAYVMDHAMKKL